MHIGPAWSQSADDPIRGLVRDAKAKEQINLNRVGLVTGSPNGTYAGLGYDLSRLLDNPADNSMRVVVSLGRGSIGNIDDLLNMERVDLAFIQSDVLDHLRRLGGEYDAIQKRLRYVTRLHKEEIHILARGSIRRFADLDGKRLSVGAAGGGSVVTAHNLFDPSAVHPVFVEEAPEKAIEDLFAGKIDAVLYVAGRPVSIFAALPGQKAYDAQLHFVSLADVKDPTYVAAALGNEDYPSLIATGERVETRAVYSVLAAFDWKPGTPRFDVVRRFVEGFLDRAPELQNPGYLAKKWCEVDFRAGIPGWQRLGVAADWLSRHSERSGPLCGSCEARFEDDMRQAGLWPLTGAMRDQTYDRWRQGKGRGC
jgi:TRAP transporter TAXI family solute receptor